MLTDYYDRYPKVKNDRGKNYRLELGMIYYNLANYSQAREQFDIQAADYQEAGNSFMQASMYNNIALTHEKEGDLKEARRNYLIAKNLLTKSIDQDDELPEIRKINFLNVVESNLASLNILEGNTSGAEQIYLKELSSSQVFRQPRITRQAYLNLTELYLIEGKSFWPKNTSIPQGSTRSDSPVLRTAGSEATGGDDLFIAGLYRTAVTCYRAYQRLNDSLQLALQNRVVEEAAVKFDVDATRDQLQDSKDRLEQKSRQLIWSVVGLITVVILVVVVGFQYTLSRKRNKKIYSQRNQLERALKEKAVMLDETHHRIKNNLQLVNGLLELQKEKLINGAQVEVFSETQNYILSMAIVQELLYEQEDFQQINLDTYLTTLVDHLLGRYATTTWKGTVDAAGIIIETQTAVTLGLIVTELVTNSIKHIDSPRDNRLRISLDDHMGIIYFTYADSGTSNAGQVFSTGHTGKGLQIIRLLVEELEGSLLPVDAENFTIQITFNRNHHE